MKVRLPYIKWSMKAPTLFTHVSLIHNTAWHITDTHYLFLNKWGNLAKVGYMTQGGTIGHSLLGHESWEMARRKNQLEWIHSSSRALTVLCLDTWPVLVPIFSQPDSSAIPPSILWPTLLPSNKFSFFPLKLANVISCCLKLSNSHW